MILLDDGTLLAILVGGILIVGLVMFFKLM